MDTTITGIFPDQRLATMAVAHLRTAGFGSTQLRVVDANAPDRHHFIAERTADTKRGWRLGIVFGPIAGLAAGLLLSNELGPGPALIGGLAVGIIGGTVLGLMVGRATSTQMQDEIEHQVEDGNVLVSVQTDSAHSEKALALLAQDGAVNMVSTAASFRAGVLPINQPGELQQELPPKQQQALASTPLNATPAKDPGEAKNRPQYPPSPQRDVPPKHLSPSETPNTSSTKLTPDAPPKGLPTFPPKVDNDLPPRP